MLYSRNVFSKIFFTSQNPCLVLPNEFGPDEVGVSLYEWNKKREKSILLSKFQLFSTWKKLNSLIIHRPMFREYLTGGSSSSSSSLSLLLKAEATLIFLAGSFGLAVDNFNCTGCSPNRWHSFNVIDFWLIWKYCSIRIIHLPLVLAVFQKTLTPSKWQAAVGKPNHRHLTIPCITNDCIESLSVWIWFFVLFWYYKSICHLFCVQMERFFVTSRFMLVIATINRWQTVSAAIQFSSTVATAWWTATGIMAIVRWSGSGTGTWPWPRTMLVIIMISMSILFFITIMMMCA